MEQDDPQVAPEGQAPEPGQGEPEVKSPEAAPDEGQLLKERLEKLERSYNEAQRIIGRQGKELGELRKFASPQKQEETIPPDAFFTDPVGVTKKLMSSTLSEFEARQEQRRQAERYLRTFAEKHGISEEDLQRWNDEYETAQSDPDARLNLLLNIHRAQNAAGEIQKASQTVKDTVTRNARAVTTESAGMQVPSPGKSFEDMTVAEMREYLIKKHGAPAPEY